MERTRGPFVRNGHDIPPQHIGALGDEIALFLGAEADRAFDQPELETKSVGRTPDAVEPNRTPPRTLSRDIAPLGNSIGKFGF